MPVSRKTGPGRPPMPEPSRDVCLSGKKSFWTRKAAKEFANKSRRRGGDRLQTYECTDCEFYHNGHPPAAVKYGVMSADEFYGRQRYRSDARQAGARQALGR